MIKAFLQIFLGLTLLISGIALEGLWLAFCFGTIVVGIVLLLWFTPILFFPFAILSIPGWRILNHGLHDLRPVNVGKVSAAIAPLIASQITEIERTGSPVPLDARVLIYVAALSFVASRRNLSLQNVIDITSTFYTNPKHQLSVKNLHYCVDYSDDLKSFWEAARRMTPIAQREMASGQGSILVKLAEESRPV